MTRVWIQILLVVVALFGRVDTAAADDTSGYCGRSYDTTVDAGYAIQGTWMYSRLPCEWQNALEAFHRIGGNTVLQFGPSLRRFSPTEQDGIMAACSVNGVSCVDDAINEIGAGRIRNWLKYEFGEHYGDAIACPSGLDKKIQVATGNGVRTYWRIVLPHKEGQPSCDYSQGTFEFDVLFVHYEEASTESVRAMLTAADHLGMEAYLAAPAFPVNAGAYWEIDAALLYAHRDWARRVYADWAVRHAGHASFRGTYQSYELPVGSGYQSPYDEYEVDAQAFHAQHQGRKYVISPYLMLRRSGTVPNTIQQAVEGFRKLAEKGVDIVAPQDGRGTSLGAHYWDYQAGEAVGSVDPALANYPEVDGDRTFSQEYVASARDVFRALAQERALLNQQGYPVALWANVEAFEEDTESPTFASCADGLSQTTKVRMDRAITFVGGTSDRIISFMYDPLFLCANRFGTSLLQAIRDDHERPLVMDAFFWDSPTNGLALRGHRLAWGSTFVVTWYDANWNAHSQQIAPGWVSPSSQPGVPDVIWLPFDRSNLASAFYIHVNASRPTSTGTKDAHWIFSLKY